MFQNWQLISSLYLVQQFLSICHLFWFIIVIIIEDFTADGLRKIFMQNRGDGEIYFISTLWFFIELISSFEFAGQHVRKFRVYIDFDLRASLVLTYCSKYTSAQYTGPSGQFGPDGPFVPVWSWLTVHQDQTGHESQYTAVKHDQTGLK